MARSKAPRKRKPGKSGKPSVACITPPSYPKRFMVTLLPDTDANKPDEFFYDTPAEAIQHCVRLGPQFYLDTHFDPPLVTIIRGFEQHPGEANDVGYDSIDGAMTESMPLDEFMDYTELEIMSVSFAPWDKSTNNWADSPDELDCDCGQYVDFRFTGKIPGL